MTTHTRRGLSMCPCIQHITFLVCIAVLCLDATLTAPAFGGIIGHRFGTGSTSDLKPMILPERNGPGTPGGVVRSYSFSIRGPDGDTARCVLGTRISGDRTTERRAKIYEVTGACEMASKRSVELLDKLRDESRQGLQLAAKFAELVQQQKHTAKQETTCKLPDIVPEYTPNTLHSTRRPLPGDWAVAEMKQQRAASNSWTSSQTLDLQTVQPLHPTITESYVCVVEEPHHSDHEQEHTFEASTYIPVEMPNNHPWLHEDVGSTTSIPSIPTKFLDPYTSVAGRGVELDQSNDAQEGGRVLSDNFFVTVHPTADEKRTSTTAQTRYLESSTGDKRVWEPSKGGKPLGTAFLQSPSVPAPSLDAGKAVCNPLEEIRRQATTLHEPRSRETATLLSSFPSSPGKTPTGVERGASKASLYMPQAQSAAVRSTASVASVSAELRVTAGPGSGAAHEKEERFRTNNLAYGVETDADNERASRPKKSKSAKLSMFAFSPGSVIRAQRSMSVPSFPTRAQRKATLRPFGDMMMTVENPHATAETEQAGTCVSGEEVPSTSNSLQGISTAQTASLAQVSAAAPKADKGESSAQQGTSKEEAVKAVFMGNVGPSEDGRGNISGLPSTAIEGKSENSGTKLGGSHYVLTSDDRDRLSKQRAAASKVDIPGRETNRQMQMGQKDVNVTATAHQKTSEPSTSVKGSPASSEVATRKHDVAPKREEKPLPPSTAAHAHALSKVSRQRGMQSLETAAAVAEAAMHAHATGGQKVISGGGRKGFGLGFSDWVLGQESKGKERYLILFDLDHCAIFGMDGNDLGIAMQLEGLDHETIVQLYTHLINPELIKLTNSLKASGKTFEVACFTRRAHLLRYHSKIRRETIALSWNNDWHLRHDQVVIPPHVVSANQVMDEYSGEVVLKFQERLDLRMGFDRLISARDAIHRALSLPYTPKIILTAGAKQVGFTAEKLGYAAEHAYMWDDNSELKGIRNVYVVDKYSKMPSSLRESLCNFLDRTLPASRLSPETITFMLGAKRSEVSLSRSDDGKVEYMIPEGGQVRSFPVPPPMVGPREENSPGSSAHVTVDTLHLQGSHQAEIPRTNSASHVILGPSSYMSSHASDSDEDSSAKWGGASESPHKAGRVPRQGDKGGGQSMAYGNSGDGVGNKNVITDRLGKVLEACSQRIGMLSGLLSSC